MTTLHPFGSDVRAVGEGLIGAILGGMVFLATKSATPDALLLGLLGNNNLFGCKFCLFVCFKFWASSSVVPCLAAVSALSHSFPIAQLWLSIVQ